MIFFVNACVFYCFLSFSVAGNQVAGRMNSYILGG